MECKRTTRHNATYVEKHNNSVYGLKTQFKLVLTIVDQKRSWYLYVTILMKCMSFFFSKWLSRSLKTVNRMVAHRKNFTGLTSAPFIHCDTALCRHTVSSSPVTHSIHGVNFFSRINRNINAVVTRAEHSFEIR